MRKTYSSFLILAKLWPSGRLTPCGEKPLVRSADLAAICFRLGNEPGTLGSELFTRTPPRPFLPLWQKFIDDVFS